MTDATGCPVKACRITWNGKDTIVLWNVRNDYTSAPQPLPFEPSMSCLPCLSIIYEPNQCSCESHDKNGFYDAVVPKIVKQILIEATRCKSICGI